jgi:hypothetical protein
MMQKRRTILIFLGILAGAALLLAACSPEVVTQEVIVTQEVEVTRVVTVEPAPVEPPVEEVTVAVPFQELWESSAHADTSAEAFTHWDEDDPAVVPIACAKCHSTPGYQDFLGLDGSAFGSVDADHPVGTTVQCEACHNDATLNLTSVVMPSGVEITDLGDEARCMQCHQGRESKVSLDEAIGEAGVDDDEVSEDLGFVNIHYYPAAATKYGTIAMGGYQYDGKTYDANFAHVAQFDTCIECHNPHTLEVRVDQCSACHTGVASVEDLQNVRMPGSQVDYDGDGDLEEGIYFELQGLQELLLQAIQGYASEQLDTDIGYSAAAYPYFFLDPNGDGEITEDEAISDNRFSGWTPRLLRAAYNFQMSQKDPGAFAHGGKYIIQLLYDSIEDLNSVLSAPVDMSAANRIDDGHFAGSEEAFRHWDGEEDGGIVPPTCSKCHTAEGLPLFLRDNTSISQHASNGFQCTTCHSSLETFERYEVAEVTFPSGATINSGNNDTNLCMNCHQGRTSTVSVDGAIAGKDLDTIDDSIRFQNIHYFAAGATRYGTEVQGAYEYEGNDYNGWFEHMPAVQNCTDCHTAHGLDVQVEKCSGCHTGIETEEDLQTIRMSTDDFDGDGDITEGIAGEIATMQELLLVAMNDYAASTEGVSPITYNGAAYPYFFDDAGEGYATWTPRMLQAAYNYQYSTKDPGAFAHNGRYILQTLYDSIADLGGDTSGMIRPEVVVAADS